jgi:PAS domain S-box-containing protein
MDDIEREQLRSEREQLRSEVATLRLLLEVNEAAALEQAKRADQALDTLRQQAAVREQQSKLVHEIIAASSDAVLVLDRNWEFLYVNRRARDDIFSGKDVVGTNLVKDFPEIVPASFYRRYQKAMDERVPVVFEDFYGPRERWLAVSVSPVGRGIAIFFRDVTERRLREAALHKTEKLAAVGRLASSISHEINNPLESVVNLLYLIEHPDVSTADMKTYASLAQSELARVSHIVTNTLKFHRQTVEAAECRMSEIMDSVVSLFQGRLTTRHILVTREYSTEDTVTCFAGDIRQVFANLIANSLDAMPDSGQLHLRVHPSCDWRTGRKGLRVLVADNGSGMSAATLRTLFEPFVTTKPTTGTGLGLWVSEEIVRNHQGTIRPRSSQRPGRTGTAFSVFFPRTV